MTRRVDAHFHVWDLTVATHDWLDEPSLAPIRRTFDLDDLAAAARGTGIETGVLVQVVASVAETREFLALAAADDRIAAVVGWLDLTDPGAADVIAELRAGPGGRLLAGFRHLVQGEADPDWLARPDVLRGLRAVAGAGLAYDLLTLPHQLPAAIQAVRAVPESTFVLDHLSKPPISSGELEPWASRIRELAAAPNVYCKLSGMVTEADWQNWTVADLRRYAEVVLEAFGPHRVMFGSDWPVCLLAAGYADVVAAAEKLCAGLSPAERDDVFGATAARAYRLSPEPA